MTPVEPTGVSTGFGADVAAEVSGRYYRQVCAALGAHLDQIGNFNTAAFAYGLVRIRFDVRDT